MLFSEFVASRDLVISDGAVGTMLPAIPFREDNPEMYVHTPDMYNLIDPRRVDRVHLEYMENGADIITTNTFLSNSWVQQRYGYEEEAEEMAYRGAIIANDARHSYGRLLAPFSRSVFIGGSVGPIGLDVDSTPFYHRHVMHLLMGGVDFIKIESMVRVNEIVESYLGARAAMDDLGRQLPITLSFSVDVFGRLCGSSTTLRNLIPVIQKLRPFAVGLNCIDPQFALRHMVYLREKLSDPFLTCEPFASLGPPGPEKFRVRPDEFHHYLWRLHEEAGVRILGSCCHSNPNDTLRLAAANQTQSKTT